jgi:acyl carrier protein
MALIKSSQMGCDGELSDDTSLIKSGLIDSLALFNVALFIESEIGGELDVATLNIAEDWDTITDMHRYILTHRRGQADSPTSPPPD